MRVVTWYCSFLIFNYFKITKAKKKKNRLFLLHITPYYKSVSQNFMKLIILLNQDFIRCSLKLDDCRVALLVIWRNQMSLVWNIHMELWKLFSNVLTHQFYATLHCRNIYVTQYYIKNIKYSIYYILTNWYWCRNLQTPK